MASSRIIKINKAIKKELADIIRNEVKDDRLLPMTTVTDVNTTGDLKFADVSVSVYDDSDKKRSACIDALNHASSFIRTCLAKRLPFRTVPQLTFTLDKNIEYSFYIEKKLKEVMHDE